MTEFRQLLSNSTFQMPEVERHLDSLSSEARIAATRSLGKKQLAALYDAADGYKAIGLDDVVPSSNETMEEVVHHGKNSLGAFTTFAKVFVRPENLEPSGPQLWGYNRNSAFLETVVGPGYFMTYPHSVTGEVLVDYLQVPPSKPDGWPEILPNSSRLSYFVYNGTQDILRGVSDHVSIGRAMKAGKPMSAWFILCREG